MGRIGLCKRIVHQEYLALIPVRKEIRLIFPHVVKEAGQDHKSRQESFAAGIFRHLCPGNGIFPLGLDLIQADLHISDADHRIVQISRGELRPEIFLGVSVLLQDLDTKLAITKWVP